MDSATRSQPPVTDESNHKTRAYTFTKLLRTPSSCPQFPTISAKIKYTLDIPNEAALGTEQTALGYLDVLVEKLRPVELRVEVFVGSERVEEERGRCIAEWLMETIGANLGSLNLERVSIFHQSTQAAFESPSTHNPLQTNTSYTIIHLHVPSSSYTSFLTTSSSNPNPNTSATLKQIKLKLDIDPKKAVSHKKGKGKRKAGKKGKGAAEEGGVEEGEEVDEDAAMVRAEILTSLANGQIPMNVSYPLTTWLDKFLTGSLSQTFPLIFNGDLIQACERERSGIDKSVDCLGRIFASAENKVKRQKGKEAFKELRALDKETSLLQSLLLRDTSSNLDSSTQQTFDADLSEALAGIQQEREADEEEEEEEGMEEAFARIVGWGMREMCRVKQGLPKSKPIIPRYKPTPSQSFTQPSQPQTTSSQTSPAIPMHIDSVNEDHIIEEEEPAAPPPRTGRMNERNDNGASQLSTLGRRRRPLLLGSGDESSDGEIMLRRNPRPGSVSIGLNSDSRMRMLSPTSNSLRSILDDRSGLQDQHRQDSLTRFRPTESHTARRTPTPLYIRLKDSERGGADSDAILSEDDEGDLSGRRSDTGRKSDALLGGKKRRLLLEESDEGDSSDQDWPRAQGGMNGPAIGVQAGEDEDILQFDDESGLKPAEGWWNARQPEIDRDSEILFEDEGDDPRDSEAPQHRCAEANLGNRSQSRTAPVPMQISDQEGDEHVISEGEDNEQDGEASRFGGGVGGQLDADMEIIESEME